MAKPEQTPDDVPAGAAVFPLIPDDLGLHPLLLVALHAVVFLDGSSDDVVNPAAGEEALQYLANYLGRLKGNELKRVREDMEVLLAFAREQKWPDEEMKFLRGFLSDFGVGAENE